MQGLLYAPAIQGADGPVRGPQATSAIREQQLRMAVHRPELAQNAQRRIGQRHQAVTVAFGVADVHAAPCAIDIADLQGQALAKAQAQAVQHKIKHPVAQGAGGSKQGLRLCDGDDIGQASRLGWLDKMGHAPGFAQHMQGVELQTVEVEFDGAPGVRGYEVAEVVGELRFRQGINVMGEVVTDAPDGAGFRLDGFGL